jgi:DNA-directed RNA polymerase specialized sigma24 family protein
MATSHNALPPPYDELLAPADLARYGAVLPARQAAALRLRWAGFTYAQIGNRLGLSTPSAYSTVTHACEHLDHAKQQADALTPREDRP